jgi:hypothetical protein
MTWGRASDFRMHGAKKIKRYVKEEGKQEKTVVVSELFIFSVR